MSNVSNVTDLRTRASLRVAANDVAGAAAAMLPETIINLADVKAYLEGQNYSQLIIEFDEHERVLWYFMEPTERPSTTVALMRDARQLQKTVINLFAQWSDPADQPIRYLAVGRACPVFLISAAI